MTDAVQGKVQRAMKQTAKTDAEQGEAPDDRAPPMPTSENEVREGDKPVDQSKTGGSSPYDQKGRANSAE